MLQSSHVLTGTEQLATTERPDGAAPVHFLAIGHVSRDLLSNDPRSSQYTLGGTASFAAVTAVRLGRHPTIVTRAAPDMDLSALPPGVALRVLPSQTTTTFANIYTGQGRVQYCYTPAQPIRAADIPPELRRPQIVLLGPIANEIEADVATIFAADTLVGAVPQGWMRRWDGSGRVYSQPWHSAQAILPHLDVLVLSLEDIDGDRTRLEPFFEHVPLVVLTEYRDGSTLHQRREDGSVAVTQVPPRPARELDPTGAGDIFATAFLLQLRATGDPLHAARYANVTASFGVEGRGVAGIPSHRQVMAYMHERGWVEP